MSTLRTVKTFIHQRLAVAVDEIFGLLETTISNYEEELDRQRRLLEDDRYATCCEIFINHDIKKITFQNGLPSSVEDMIKVFKQALSITTDTGLQYKDANFDDFFTLTSTSDLKDKDTLKVVHKPHKSEVNFLPPHPAGETDSSLESLRLEQVAVSRTKDNTHTINDMMSGTYSCRRREVVGQSMQVAELKERWPALFDPVQINDEFRRCNTVPLESTFISQLDRYTPKLLELFNSKRGAVGQRMKIVLVELIKDPDVVKKRDMTLRCLIEYMGESVQELISDYSRTPEDKVHEDLKAQSMRIYICQQPVAVGIIIDGTPVLTGLDNVPRACCLLLGLTCSLNLDYPPKLAETFKVFQRQRLQLKPTSKYISLKNKLLSRAEQGHSSHQTRGLRRVSGFCGVLSV
ncbi:uncharacterized protein [Trachinotus anak]|uniref:uncharacterized protein n=1 Tax=Trachinotus anak TaxID=443729 RepID=UPI0039F2003E